MDIGIEIKGLIVLVPIVAMLALGLWVALRSGVASLHTGQGLRQLVGNLSQTALLVAGWVVVMLFVQALVGYRIGSTW